MKRRSKIKTWVMQAAFGTAVALSTPALAEAVKIDVGSDQPVVIDNTQPIKGNCSRLLTGLLRVGADGMVDGGLAA